MCFNLVLPVEPEIETSTTCQRRIKMDARARARAILYVPKYGLLAENMSLFGSRMSLFVPGMSLKFWIWPFLGEGLKGLLMDLAAFWCIGCTLR